MVLRAPASPAQSLCFLLVLVLLLFVFLVLVLVVYVCCCFFVHSFVLYVFMCACFWLCVLFPVVVVVLFLRLRDVRRVPCSFWGHFKETCNMFQYVSEWFGAFGIRWVCASRDGSFIGGLES